jgi:hypothetical protein
MGRRDEFRREGWKGEVGIGRGEMGVRNPMEGLEALCRLR